MKRRTWFFFLVSISLTSLSWADITPIKEIFSPDPVLYPTSLFSKVAVIQWANTIDTPLNVTNFEAEAYKQSNREALATYMKEAALEGAKLVVTPEFAVVGYPSEESMDDSFTRKNITPYVETIPGPSTNYFSKLAQELKITIHFGMAERDAINNKYYNAQVAISPSGKILATYRKISLFAGETEFLSAGNDFVTYDSSMGKMGLAICADIYNPRVMSGYKSLGVKVLSVPTSWTIFNSAMSYFQTSAKKLGAYVLGANHFYFPDSGVVSPSGLKQSHIRQSMGVAYGYIPLLKSVPLR